MTNTPCIESLFRSDIIGLPLKKIVLIMLRNVISVKYMVTISIPHQCPWTPLWDLDNSQCGDWHHWNDWTKSVKWTSLHLGGIQLHYKWVEATSYANVTKNVVAKFIKKELIYHYGLPSKIITNNTTNLNNKTMDELCNTFKIQYHKFILVQTKINGAVEVTNKNIKKTRYM